MSHIELGLLFLGSRSPDRFVQVSQMAENAGFDYFWVPDERFFREVYSLCTVVAGVTNRIRIGPCVTDPYFRHPALTAMAIATLDEISAGRAVLGLGAGISGIQEIGLEQRSPALAVRESIELIRELISSGAAEYRGETTHFNGSLNFDPPRQSVPVYIAAAGPLMLALAGEVADGVIIEACMDLHYFDRVIGRVQRGLLRAGRARDDIFIVPRIDIAVDHSLSRAYDALRPRLAKKLISASPDFDRFNAIGLDIPLEVRERVAGLTYTWDPEVLDSLTKGLPDSYMDPFFIAATPATLAGKLDELVSRGASQIIVNPVPLVADQVEPVIMAVADYLR